MQPDPRALSPRIVTFRGLGAKARRPALELALLSAIAAPAAAQWATDPAQNFVLADHASDQNQAKLAPAPDGGAWISWLDGIGSGWDVRVQRVDGGGVEVLPHNGVLVADRSFSSTQDYGLDLDANGDALLAFRDDRPGGTQITAAKVLASGAQPFGALGVQLTSTTAFVASPKIAGTADGHAVVAWTEGSNVVLQRLDANGAPLWGTGVVLAPPSGSYGVADLHDSGNDVIVSLVHSTGGFSAPRHLRAQKLDAAGSALWSPATVAVFDGGSLQVGNFPAFSSDGAGGAVFTWYSASNPARQVFAQRIDAGGAELWPHDGVPVSANAAQGRVAPSHSFDAASGDTYVFWIETNGAQSMFGVGGQRLDPSGARLFGPNGVTVVPLGALGIDLVRTVDGGPAGGALVAWEEAPSFNADVLVGAHYDATGVRDAGPFPIASTPSGKARLAAAAGAGGFAILAWSDARTDGGDIYLQNVHFDGRLGGGLGTVYCSPAVPNSSGAPARMSALGSLLAASNDLTLVASDLPPHAFGYFLTSRTEGFVANPGGSQGNLCLAGAIGRYVGPGLVQNAGPLGRIEITADLTRHPTPAGPGAVLAGETWSFTAWFRDLAGGTATSNFADGLRIQLL